MPATTTTIDRDQREGLYELVRNHLYCIEDFWIAFARSRDYATAERLALEFREDFRLLADIGWPAKDERERFDLTMPADDLMELLTRLQRPHLRGSEADQARERDRPRPRRAARTPDHRDEYRRLIASYAQPYFSGKLKLADVTTFQLARFVDWLADEGEQGKRLSDATIANIVIPLRAALTTAKREGLIRHNPSLGLALPHREQIADDEEEIKVFSREQLAAVLAMAPERHRLLFEILATCGLRISEAIALQRLHFQLDSSTPEVCVRQALVKGRIVPPKTKYGRRKVRLPASLVYGLRSHLAEQVDQDSTALVFTNRDGNAIEPGNLRRRALKPIVQEVDAPWAGFHTFRHTFASIHPERRNQPAPAQPGARPSLGRVHALPLHPPAARGRGSGARPFASTRFQRCRR